MCFICFYILIILGNIPLSSKKHISLVDAGLDINIAFPLMLPPHRNIDLILSFDFSEGDPFEVTILILLQHILG